MTSVQQSDTVPRTANLLACKQWWKVCFLHGDQQKYYRQIYWRAAMQRLGKSPENADKSKAQFSKVIFPTKMYSPVVIENGDSFRINEYTKNKKHKAYAKNYDGFELPKSTVNVFDDPFLFGINEYDHGSDSGIDAATCTSTSKSNKKPKAAPAADVQSNLTQTNYNLNNRGGSASSSMDAGSGGYYNYANNINDDIKEYNIVAPPPRPPKSIKNLQNTTINNHLQFQQVDNE